MRNYSRQEKRLIMSQTIKFTDVETNEEIEFEVVEETRVNNVNYLLVT